MKESLESKLNRIVARNAPTRLDVVPTAITELSPSTELANNTETKQNGNEPDGFKTCSYSNQGVGDPSYWCGHQDKTPNQRQIYDMYGTGDLRGLCPTCRGGGDDPSICKCLAAYTNVCYNWHYSNGTGQMNPDMTYPTWDPPAYPYPQGCENAEMLDGAGYFQEEGIGNPETLTGERYRWMVWSYLTRTTNSDGTWTPGRWEVLPYEFFNYGNANPLDPESWNTQTVPRQQMRDAWRLWLQGGGYDNAEIPTLLQRKTLEAGCWGIIGANSGSSCEPGPIGEGNICKDNQPAGTPGYSVQNCLERFGPNCDTGLGMAPQFITNNPEQKKAAGELIKQLKLFTKKTKNEKFNR